MKIRRIDTKKNIYSVHFTEIADTYIITEIRLQRQKDEYGQLFYFELYSDEKLLADIPYHAVEMVYYDVNDQKITPHSKT